MWFHRPWLRYAGRRNRPFTGIVTIRNSSTKLQGGGARIPLVQPEAAKNAIRQLEQESARMLNVVEKKILTRAEALEQVGK
jgi:hypothetical protein